MNWITLIPQIISVAAAIKGIIDMANNNDDIVAGIKSVAPGIAHMLEEFGGAFFPNVKPELKVAAAAMAAFDPNINKWIQGSLNVVLTPSPNLKIDGFYGPLTRAAVEQLQTTLGLTVDGWAGQMTQAAIMTLMSKKLGGV